MAIATQLSFASPKPAIAIQLSDLAAVPTHIRSLLNNKNLVNSAKNIISATPETFCQAYADASQGIDKTAWVAIEKGFESFTVLSQAISSADAAGAGSLKGYAGIASAVSELGLGNLMTLAASLSGSKVAGAAATAVVTSAVGGPVVMGALITGGVGVAAYGTYKLEQFTAEKFRDWAGHYCSSLS